MGFFDSKSSSSTSGSSKTKYDPRWRQGYNKQLGMAMEAADMATPWTPSIADRSGATMDALSMLQARAGGSPLEDVAQQEAMATLGGSYLGEGNPYLDQMADTIGRKSREHYMRGVLPGVSSRWASAGGTGPGYGDSVSRANQDFATELTGSLSSLYGGAYEAERNRMLGMSQMAPALAGMDFRNIAAMQQAGAMEDMYQNALLAQERERMGWDASDLWRRTGLLQAGIGGPLVTGTEYEQDTETVSQPSGFQNMMGMMGAGQQILGQGMGLLSGGAGLLGMMMPTGGGGGGAAAAPPYQYYGMSPNQLNRTWS